MRDAILACIRVNDGATFAQLCRDVPGFAGLAELTVPAVPTVILWQGVSLKAVAALEGLVRDKQIHLEVATWSRYYADGRVLALPMADPAGKRPEQPSWLPVLYREGNAKVA